MAEQLIFDDTRDDLAFEDCVMVKSEAAADATVLVQYEDETLIEEVIVEAGGSEIVNVPNPITPLNTASPIKTGQTTSYAAGDDGDLQEGRLTDFTTLDFLNPFGNNNRFTDELGGQTYANDIVIDWSTYNQVNQSVLGWYRNVGLAVNWSTALLDASNLTISGFSQWRVPNIQEAFSIINVSNTTVIDYSPLNVSLRCWTSSTRSNVITDAYRFGGTTADIVGQVSKSVSAASLLAVRTFTWNGTALT